MARVYADRAALVAYAPADQQGDIPAEPEATRLLTRASRRVDRLLFAAVYDTDPVSLLPTDADVATALSEATCEQALWWLETGDESGASQQYQSVSAGSISLTRGYSSGGSATGRDQNVSPAAVEVLQLAGLLPGTITTYGPA